MGLRNRGPLLKKLVPLPLTPGPQPTMAEQFRTVFNNAIIAEEEKKGQSSTYLSDSKHQYIMSRLDSLEGGAKKEGKDYRLIKHYAKRSSLIQGILVEQLFNPKSGLLYIAHSQLFDAIREQHLTTGHGARDIMHQKTRLKYANITKDQLQLFADLCEECQLKKKKVRKSVVVKPIVSRYFNHRCQCDLIDMQSEPDGDFRFILNYQDHLTKFLCLRPLKNKSADEVADHLLEIFCLLGAPHILHSDNGREFANSVVTSVARKWPDCKLVRGKPRHSQSQVCWFSTSLLYSAVD